MKRKDELSNHKGDFVQVNGIRLHYLDWDGAGPALIFLTGMGSTVYLFNKFAPRFHDKFRVLALTRRGHGNSDYPETGYGADILTVDIRQFMDRSNIEKAALAGHSIAGVELTHFAAAYPTMVEKLIYRDALDDRRGLRAISGQSPLGNIEIIKEQSALHTLEESIADFKRDFPCFADIWSDLWEGEISHGVKVNEAGVFVDRMPAAIEKMMAENLIDEYAPKRVEAKTPILGIHARKKSKLSNACTEEQKAAFVQFNRNAEQAFFKSLIYEFQNRFPHAKITVIPDGHHHCFIVQEELVHHGMQKFLLEQSSPPDLRSPLPKSRDLGRAGF